jgi:hypothetical protein
VLSDPILKVLQSHGFTKITDMEEEPYYWRKVNMPLEDFINKSYVIGLSEIIIGFYKNEELRTASIFHEIWHTLYEYKEGDSVIDREEHAWNIGFTLAKKHGFWFSCSTYEWASKQIETYQVENATK